MNRFKIRQLQRQPRLPIPGLAAGRLAKGPQSVQERVELDPFRQALQARVIAGRSLLSGELTHLDQQDCPQRGHHLPGKLPRIDSRIQRPVEHGEPLPNLPVHQGLEQVPDDLGRGRPQHLLGQRERDLLSG